MPTFMQSLSSNPSGTGVYGATPQQSDQDVLGIVNRIKDRDMMDFQEKANFMSDLTLRQNRLQKLYGGDSIDPATAPIGGSPQDSQGQPGVQQPQNTVLDKSQEITPYQQGQLGIDRAKLQQEQQKIGQSEEATTIKSAQEKLNQQKSDQINANKQAQLEDNVRKEQDNVKIAQQKLEQAGNDFATRTAAMQDYQKAMEAYHNANMERLQGNFDITSKQHQQTIDDMQKKIDQMSKTTTKTAINPEGTEKTVTTQRGNEPPPGRVWGIGKDGNQYPVPIDKIDDWNANHAARGTEIQAPSDQSENNPGGN